MCGRTPGPSEPDVPDSKGQGIHLFHRSVHSSTTQVGCPYCMSPFSRTCPPFWNAKMNTFCVRVCVALMPCFTSCPQVSSLLRSKIWSPSLTLPPGFSTVGCPPARLFHKSHAPCDLTCPHGTCTSKMCTLCGDVPLLLWPAGRRSVNYVSRALKRLT